MKILKTIAVAALLVVGTSVMAQGPGQGQRRSSSERAKATVETLTTTLSLTPDQKAKVLEVSMKYAAKDSIRMTSMMNGGQDIDREAMRTEMTKAREDQAKEIKAILTDAQKTKYDEYQATARQGFGGGGPRN